jgi:ElaB/YqjD/DUF883 family membrane-anchored ribosome-binding protein
MNKLKELIKQIEVVIEKEESEIDNEYEVRKKLAEPGSLEEYIKDLEKLQQKIDQIMTRIKKKLDKSDDYCSSSSA